MASNCRSGAGLSSVLQGHRKALLPPGLARRTKHKPASQQFAQVECEGTKVSGREGLEELLFFNSMQHSHFLSEIYQMYHAIAEVPFASEIRYHRGYNWYFFLKQQYCSLLVNHVNLTFSGGIENMHAYV